jgi:hypothetical protein
MIANRMLQLLCSRRPKKSLTGQNTFLFKGNSSAENHSSEKFVYYALVLELQINPVKFH